MMRTRILTVAVLAAALMVSAALAQQQQPPGTQRVSGTIERVDGNTVYGKGSDGSAITLKLADNVAITAVLKATFADIKPGDYVGTGAVPQADGRQKAGEFGCFPRPQAGGGDPSIVVKYPQGEKRIVIPANAHVVRNAFGTKDDLQAGAFFRAQAAS